MDNTNSRNKTLLNFKGKTYKDAVRASFTIEHLNNKLQRTLNLPNTGCWSLEFKGNILENKTTTLSDFISENELKMPLEISIQEKPITKEAGQRNSRIQSKSMFYVIS